MPEIPFGTGILKSGCLENDIAAGLGLLGERHRRRNLHDLRRSNLIIETMAEGVAEALEV